MSVVKAAMVSNFTKEHFIVRRKRAGTEKIGGEHDYSSFR